MLRQIQVVVQVIARHLDETMHWNVAIPSEMQELPSLYWLPKLHKNPYGARFTVLEYIGTQGLSVFG